MTTREAYEVIKDMIKANEEILDDISFRINSEDCKSFINEYGHYRRVKSRIEALNIAANALFREG